MGYTTLTVRAAAPGEPTRYPVAPGLAVDERTLENEHLTVRAEADGTLTVTDHAGGRAYARLLTFEDVADIGDGWFHGAAANDRAVLSPGCPAEITLMEDGPLCATLRVRLTMSVPARFDFARMARADERAPLIIESRVTLRRGARHVEISTHVENVARDHRLRVLLPSRAAAAETYLADSPFDVVERPIALRADNHLYRELEVETKPQQSWTAVQAGDRGLAVISAGLLESAVRDLPERPIALTLYRSTQRTVNTDGEPGGQLLGPLDFDYWLMPLAETPDRAALCTLGQRLAAGLRNVQLRAVDVRRGRDTGPAGAALPAEGGYLGVSGGAVLTSAPPVGEALEVRLFNPAEGEIDIAIGRPADAPPARLRLAPAQRVDFESHPLGAAHGPRWRRPLSP
jgi:alpha-mannosidase/mannosylglycerate hydrolase